jgi:hypothetical protein
MAQYKTISGPIGLRANGNKGYEYAVRQYAKIIDKEAVGGWELHLIQQIAVEKLVWRTVIIGAIIGLILGIAAESVADIDVAIILGPIIGAIIGCTGIKIVTVLFNMLIFVKHDGGTGISSGYTAPIMQTVASGSAIMSAHTSGGGSDTSEINASSQEAATQTSDTASDTASMNTNGDNSDTWVCNNCYVKNPISTVICQGCGKSE